MKDKHFLVLVAIFLMCIMGILYMFPNQVSEQKSESQQVCEFYSVG